MMYELRDVNDKFIKEITYKEMMEKLNNHEASQIKENKRIVGCWLYEPIKTIEIEQEQQQEEVIKDNIEIAENDDLPSTKKIIIRTIIGAPLFLSFFLMVVFMKEIFFILAVLLMFYMLSVLRLMVSARVSAVRYCANREAYNAYKGRK